ncbi:cysteine-rich receptor-like protein kinase 8 [Tanacetum coccineum]
MILISKKLIGSENYTMWKRSMMIALSARNKIKLINGEFEEPDVSSPIRSYWERANDMLHNEIVHLKQMNCSVEVFYHKLKGLWDELDALEAPYNCTCKFAKAYSMLRHEEKQREVPKQTTSSVPFALNTYRPNTPYVAARNNKSQNTQTQPRRSTFRLGVIYGNCNKEGHTKEECYKLSSNPQSSSRAVNMTVVHDTPVDSDTSSSHMTTLPPDCSVTARMDQL